MADTETDTYELRPIGFVRSALRSRPEAPRQAFEGAPPARVEILPEYRDLLDGISTGDDVLVLTWLHQSDRTARHTHPGGDLSLPLAGVFATRSPDRPNPIGLHRVTVTAMTEGTLAVGALEAIDGTPVVDIKPVMAESAES
ncbi:MAG TPA: tRNA (N6-threonylcarbamoyladenosine(37)-N6)-methyltransferase TrmO [Gaiellales bacterium]|jgi:tRNA-Thr(GGU) m(6)t(6)A37 methyltransferase TsaA